MKNKPLKVCLMPNGISEEDMFNYLDIVENDIASNIPKPCNIAQSYTTKLGYPPEARSKSYGATFIDSVIFKLIDQILHNVADWANLLRTHLIPMRLTEELINSLKKIVIYASSSGTLPLVSLKKGSNIEEILFYNNKFDSIVCDHDENLNVINPPSLTMFNTFYSPETEAMVDDSYDDEITEVKDIIIMHTGMVVTAHLVKGDINDYICICPPSTEYKAYALNGECILSREPIIEYEDWTRYK